MSQPERLSQAGVELIQTRKPSRRARVHCHARRPLRQRDGVVANRDGRQLTQSGLMLIRGARRDTQRQLVQSRQSQRERYVVALDAATERPVWVVQIIGAVDISDVLADADAAGKHPAVAQSLVQSEIAAVVCGV